MKDTAVQVMMMIWKNHNVKVVTQENQVIIASLKSVTINIIRIVLLVLVLQK